MVFDRKRYVDVGPSPAEQLAAGLAEKGNPQPAETPRSRVLVDIDAAIRDFERNPEAYSEQIKELQELAESFSGYTEDDAVALADTQAQLEAIKEGALADVRGGNGPEAPVEPIPEPAPADARLRLLGEELTQAITEVEGRVAALEDDPKKAVLGRHLVDLQGYKKIVPRKRNEEWEQRVREKLALIRSIISPKRERPVRERPVPKAEEAVAPVEAVPEAVESETDGEKLVARAQEALRTIMRSIGTGKSSHVGRKLAFNIGQAQEKLESAKDFGISESGLGRIRAITEKLQALAVGFERDDRKNWETDVQQRSFELAIALTHAMPAEHKSAAGPKYVRRTEVLAAQPEVVADAQTEAPEREPELFPDERENSVRAAALYTINKLKSYAELQHAEDGTLLGTEEQRKARFKELVKKYWTEFTVHGTHNTREGTKTPGAERKVRPWSDIDGAACLFLLKEAGIDVHKGTVNYVAQGKSSESGVVMDTSNNLGVIADKGGKRITFDHHNPYASRDISASKLLYDTLSNLDIGLLKKEPWFDAFVEYVTKEDNKSFTDEESKALLENYGHNFVSLARNLDFDQMKKFFKEQADTHYTVYERLPDDYLRQFKFKRNPLGGDMRPQALEDRIKDREQKKQESLEGISALEEQGSVLDTGDARYGKVLIDTGMQDATGKWLRKVPMDFDAVRAKGYGAYLVWLPENNQFFLKSAKRIDFDVSDGYNVRGYYILKGDPTTELHVTLEDIKAKLMGEPGSATEQRATIATEAAGTYDPEQEIGAPQAPERAEVIAPVEAAIPVSSPKPQLEAEEAEYEKRMLAALELEGAEDGARETLRAAPDEAERKERMHRELVAQKKELDNLIAQYEATADSKEQQELGEEIKAKGMDFFEKLEAFERLDKKV